MNYIERSGSNGADLRTIADYLPSPIFYCDRDLVYRYVNPAGADIHGKPIHDIVGKRIDEIMAPDQVKLLEKRHDQVLSGESLKFEESRKFRNGGDRRVQTEYIPDIDETGSVVGFFVMLTDVTERYTAEMAGQETTRQLQAISDAVPAQVCFLDRERRYIWVNKTTADWFGTDVESIVGRTTEEMLGTELVANSQEYLYRVFRGERIDYEATYQFPDGKERTVDVSYIPNIRQNGEIDGYIVLAHDVTDYRRAADELEMLATTDSLTGVKNRRRFLEICDDEITRANRYRRPLSLVMCDIDYFKNVNDMHGHDGGDAVLKIFASLVSDMLRVNVDTIGRLGGEEFALILPETDLEEARQAAERVREACEKTVIPLPAGKAEITCSFGVTELSGNEDDGVSMLKRADVALYSAKKSGRNRVCVEVMPDSQTVIPDRTVSAS